MMKTVFLSCLFLVISIYAQATGSISGRIFDAETGEPLPGATVRIETIARSTGADVDGRYILQNIPAGTYDIKVSNVGYGIQIIEGVEVESGLESAVNVRMVSSPIIGKAVEVSTPTRRTQLLKDTPEITMVVRDIDLERISPKSIADAVAYLPGVSIEGGTGSGQPDDKIVSINGLPAHYSIVLMDGARVVSSHWHTGASVNIIPPEAIEQIEVVKGAASAQYGSEGMGGILNIITKRGNRKEKLAFSAYGASRNTQHYSIINGGEVNKSVRYNTFLSWHKTDGDSILKPAHRLGQLGYDKFTMLQSVDSDIAENLVSRAQMFYMASNSEFRGTDYQSWLITPKVEFEYSGIEKLDINLSGYYTQWSSGINGEKNEIAEPKITAGFSGLKDNYIIVGGEWTYRNFARTAVPEKDQTAIGFFMQDEWSPRSKLTLLGAVRFDKVEDIDGVLTPKLTAMYRPADKLDFRMSLGRGFRAPTVQDLYEESYGHGSYRREGNPDLKPEFSTSITGGFEIRPASSLVVLIDGYYTTLTDMITPVYDHMEQIIDSETGDTTELAIYVRQNIHDAKVYGGEVKASYNFLRSFILDAAFSYTHNENEETGTCLPYYPGMTASAKLSAFEPLNSWLGVGGFVGGNFASGRKVWNWNNTAEETELEDYLRLDAGMNIEFRGRYEIFGTAENLLGEEITTYEDAEMITAGIPQFTAGIRIRAF